MNLVLIVGNCPPPTSFLSAVATGAIMGIAISLALVIALAVARLLGGGR